MATTNAERQRTYTFQRRFAGPGGDGEKKINSWVPRLTEQNFNRLAVSYGITKKMMLIKLVEDADKLRCENMTDSERDEYFEAKTTPSKAKKP